MMRFHWHLRAFCTLLLKESDLSGAEVQDLIAEH